MKKFVSNIAIIILIAGMILSGCKKEDGIISTVNNDVNTQIQDTGDGEIVLGKKLENPYTVANMQKAYNNLIKNNKLKSVLSQPIEIKANFLYVRFLPKDTLDFNILYNDTTLELFDYPLDYQIKVSGNYYHDPNIPLDKPTWLYAVVPVDYTFQGVEHQILDKCFIPDEASEQTKIKGENYAIALAMVEYESMRLTHNLSVEEQKEAKLKRWGLPSKETPKGKFRLYNTYEKSLKGIKEVKVRVHRFTKISTIYTDISGNYKATKSFRYNVHYSIIFANRTGFKIWGNLGSVAPARHEMGWHSKKGYSQDIYTNSKAWLWATINNGVYMYREKLCPKFAINRPPAGLRIWTIRKDNSQWGGSTPMAHQISFSAQTLKDFLISFGVTHTLGVYSIVLPDIFIIPNYKNTYYAYSTIFHELSHSSHYTKSGKTYWLNYIAAITRNTGYGDGTHALDGYIGVGEMWGNYFGYICEKEYFKRIAISIGAQNDWYKPQILKDIDDTCNLSPSNIFSCLISSTTNHDKLKNKIIENYGNKEKVDKIFKDYGF